VNDFACIPLAKLKTAKTSKTSKTDKTSRCLQKSLAKRSCGQTDFSARTGFDGFWRF